MKNLLKFISISLVLVFAMYSQVHDNGSGTVEAGNDAIANNDVEWMLNNASSEAKIQKYYAAKKAGGTSANTNDVVFFINDSDLNKVQTGTTTFTGSATANVSTIVAATTVELDSDVTTDCSTAESNDACAGGVVMSNTAYNSDATPKTAIVANSLSVALGAAVLTQTIDAQNNTDGTFSLAANAVTTASTLLVASYQFNSAQSYAITGLTNKRAHVTSTSDATGEWVVINEVAAITAATAGNSSNYFRGLTQVGPDASNAAAADGIVWVQDGDILTVNYYNVGTDSNGDGQIADSEKGTLIATTTATIDDSAPTISNIEPADGTLTKDGSPALAYTMSDTGSGFGTSVTTFGTYTEVSVAGCIITDAELGVSSFSSTEIRVTYTPPVGMNFSDNAGIGATVADATIDCAEHVDGQVDEGEDRTSGGFEVDTTTADADTINKRTIDGARFGWMITAVDAASNSKVLGTIAHGDADTDLNIHIDTDVPANTPTITAAKAWDAGDKIDVSDNSSIKLTFNESIDSASVEASDFTVSGTGVVDSTIVSVTLGGTAALSNTYVYLDLAADLGPNAKPKVILVGAINDLAGNVLKPTSAQTTGVTLGTASDGVKPSLSSIVVGDNLLANNETTTITFASNENLTKTSETRANGCTCGSVMGGKISITNLNNAAGDDGTKLTVSLSTPTTGSASIKETAAPYNSSGIYGVTLVGRDAAGNKGIGGITKVTGEDVSAYFTLAGDLLGAGHVTDATLNADAEKIKVKLKNWPLADHDGDGELSDSIVGLSVNGTALTAAQLAHLHIEDIDWTEAETISIQADDISAVLAAGAITAGDTVKITYYYVSPGNVIESDTQAPSATFNPVDGAITTDTTPSFSVAWDDDEWAGDMNKTVTLSQATLKDPDGVVTDISDSMTSTDNIAFYYKPTTALALGEYTLAVKAKDTALNESSEKTAKITVKARTKTSVTITPGWNLISLPGEPADNAINAVITSSQVETVLTYNPAIPGGWKTAVRDGDTLVGSLTTIDASHAYWVLSNNSDPIKTEIPGFTGGVAQVPPAIDIHVGWNLIPAVTLSGAASWDADVYLSGVSWVKAKSWNAATETWTEVLPDLSTAPDINDTNILVGKGYWVYSTKVGVLVP